MVTEGLGRPPPSPLPATALFLAALSLAGCAAYRPLPLPAGPGVRPAVSGLKWDGAALKLPPLKPVVIDPADGIDPLEAAVLAVLNSPDLQARRAARGVTAAQVFTAGLLPDIQVAATFDHPVAGPDILNAYSVSPSIDLAALISRSSRRRAAQFTARQADLDLLWAEWSTAQQARRLAETVLSAEGRATYLRQVAAVAADRYARSAAALERRDVNAQTSAADLVLKVDTETQLAIALRDAQKARRALNALLNLAPSVVLPLVPPPPVAGYDAATIDQALASLPARRPDLLALKAGYGAQDANLRKAILAQFPLTQIALAFAHDTAGVITQGASGAFALPIFNGGRGEVRIQKATREQLRAEYQARLDQAAAEVADAEGELAGARAQAAALGTDVPRLEALVKPATAAYARGDLDSQAYLVLAQNALSKRADLEDRYLTARLAQIQLETVLFLPPAGSRSAP